MKKREFLKLSTGILAGAAITPFGCKAPTPETEQKAMLTNWAGNLTYSTSSLLEPRTVDEARTLIKGNDKLRVLGTRHCFNTIADSNHHLLSSRNFNSIDAIDPDTATIRVGGGIRYGDLCKELDQKGFALHNLASLPHISVAGACATATHGSGVTNGNLATGVAALEILTGTGEFVTFSPQHDPDAFAAAVVGLGAFGLVTHVTLKLLPSFKFRQVVYLNLPTTSLADHFDEIMSSGYSVSLFTDWQTDTINQVWIKSVAKENDGFKIAGDFYGAQPADRDVHPIIELSAENCTPQMGVPGPWYERLPHFKLDFTPSSGEELQAEYFVARDQAVEAIQAVTRFREDLKQLLFITEIRTIAADDLWMSMAYKRESVAIHFTLKPNTPGVLNFLPKLEEALRPFDPRPHWGKLFTLPATAIAARYEKTDAFKAMVAKYDPERRFRNTFLDDVLFGKS